MKPIGCATAMFCAATGLAALGCDGGESQEATTSPTGGAAESCDPAALAANKELALQVSVEVLLNGSPPDGILSPDFVAHLAGGQPDQDLGAFLGFGQAFRAGLPDAAFTFTVIRRIATNRAVEEWNAPDIAGLLAQLTAP